MKTLFTSITILAAVALWYAAVGLSNAQVPVESSTTTVTTTTSAGTVTDIGPNVIAIKGGTGDMVRYTSTKTTTYVDENGNPVTIETVRSGVPVTVYYERTSNGLVADKVIVRRSTTTSTTGVPMGSNAGTPPSIDGLISAADGDDIYLRGDTSASRPHYIVRKLTTYVDESGNPVSRKMLRPGTPVTVFYERDGDRMAATRVVVKSAVNVQRSTTTEEIVR